MISVGPGHIKHPQPRLEVEVTNNLNDPYITYIASGSSKFPQPAPEVAISPNDVMIFENGSVRSEER